MKNRKTEQFKILRKKNRIAEHVLRQLIVFHTIFIFMWAGMGDKSIGNKKALVKTRAF